MNPNRLYDYLVLSRGKIFDVVRPLSAEQYAREFPIGLNSLGRTLTHIMICEWFYVQRMLERAVPPYEQWAIQDEKPPAFNVLETAWLKQQDDTREAIGSIRDWDGRIEYPSLGGAKPMIITASANDIFTQLVLHEVHHRAQALNILRQLGITLKEDIDFNALMYARREA